MDLILVMLVMREKKVRSPRARAKEHETEDVVPYFTMESHVGEVF
jgi:endonuclease I